MNSDGSNNLSLKYQSFTSSGCGDKGIRKFAFVAKTKFLYAAETMKEIERIYNFGKQKKMTISFSLLIR